MRAALALMCFCLALLMFSSGQPFLGGVLFACFLYNLVASTLS